MASPAFRQRNRSFRLSAFLGLFLLLLLVGALGFLAFSRLNAIVETAAAASNPDNDRLLILRSLVSDLSEAENYATRYTLGRDEEQLTDFEAAKAQAMEDLRSFLALPALDTHAQAYHTQLALRIEEKFDLMRSQIDLHANGRTDQVLDQLSRSLQKTLHSSNAATPAVAPAIAKDTAEDVLALDKKESPETKQKRSGVFSRRKTAAKKDEPKPAKTGMTKDANRPAQPTAKPTAIAAEPQPVRNALPLPSKIEQQLALLTGAESDRYRENLERDMALTVRSQTVSGLIRENVAQIEHLERKANAAKAIEVAAIARTANSLIIAFCIIFPILLVLLTIGVIYYFRSMQRNEASIHAAKLQADALAAARASFLATMSHEIRTPMNAIIGFSNQLSKSSLLPKQREHLLMVQGASDHLLGIVNTVLDFSRLEAGQMQYAKLDFQLQKELGLVLELLRPQYQQKGIALSLVLDPATPKSLIGDALRLRQILLNLLTNSLKFTERGSVDLKIELLDVNTASLALRFSVTDTGMGIAEDRLGAIFKAFEQSDATISARFGGSGLGLAITKMLVEQQGGKIDIQSQVGVGTTISFELPYQIGTPTQFVPEASTAAVQSLAGKTALIVDDEPFNRMLLKELLGSWGMRTVEVDDGAEAVTQALQERFDILLMDLRMPGMNGLDATKRIRSSGTNTQTPIFILTAGIEDEKTAACITAGADQILAKPVVEKDLQQMMAAVMGLTQAHDEVALDPSAPSQALFSLQNLERMAGKNIDFVHEMVASFIATATKSQLEMKDAMAQAAWAQVSEVAHRLAAPTKHIEAMSVYDALKAIEQAHKDQAFDALPQLISVLDQELARLLPSLQLRIES